jgi:hypothetical protein
MNNAIHTVRQENLPTVGLLGLGLGLSAYISCKSGAFDQSTCWIALALLIAGVLQIFSGLRYQHQGRSHAAATFLPFGIFWLSIIGYQIFPKLGLGQAPNAIAMFSYLSLWALFVAIIFLASFRQNVAVLWLYGSMMMSFMALAADQLRADRIFLIIGCIGGFLAAFFALYIGLAQFSQDCLGRRILPLGESLDEPE